MHRRVAARRVRVIAGLAFALLVPNTAALPGRIAPVRKLALFDGRSLAGWHVESINTNSAQTPLSRIFRVEGEAIHVYAGLPDGTPQPHAILATNRDFADYTLHVEYRWGTATFLPRKFAERDAGVLLQIGPERPGLVRTWYRWPKSLEFQIMEGATGDAYTLKSRAMGFADPVTRAYLPRERGGVPIVARLIDHDYASYKLGHAAGSDEQPGWNSLDAVVRGANARFYLNGRLVNVIDGLVEDRAGPPVAMTRGRIALQAEGAEIYYRNVTIAPATRQ